MVDVNKNLSSAKRLIRNTLMSYIFKHSDQERDEWIKELAGHPWGFRHNGVRWPITQLRSNDFIDLPALNKAHVPRFTKEREFWDNEERERKEIEDFLSQVLAVCKDITEVKTVLPPELRSNEACGIIEGNFTESTRPIVIQAQCDPRWQDVLDRAFLNKLG